MRRLNSIHRFALLLLVALFSITSASAQLRYTYLDSLGTYKVVFRPAVQSDDFATRYRIPIASGTNEVRLGVGYPTYVTWEWTTDSYWDKDFRSTLDPKHYRIAPARWITVGAEMGSWLKEWFYLGGTVVYTGGFKRVEYIPLRTRRGTYSFNNFAFMPEVRFAWVRRDIVQLYSGLGVGIQFAVYDEYETKQTGLDCAFDVTFIGISVGRKFFGYFDIGQGSRGILSVGVGYRFNTK